MEVASLGGHCGHRSEAPRSRLCPRFLPIDRVCFCWYELVLDTIGEGSRLSFYQIRGVSSSSILCNVGLYPALMEFVKARLVQACCPSVPSSAGSDRLPGLL